MDDLFAKRRSLRVLDPAATVADADLQAVIDATIWAPTWGGTQPVRLIVGNRGDDTFTRLGEALFPGNAWARLAGTLILFTTEVRDDPVADRYADIDLGLALGQAILQANSLGYIAHPMAGADFDAARVAFSVPADFRPLVVLAIGRPGDPAAADPKVVERDAKPRRRLPQPQVVFAGSYGKPLQ